MTITKEDLAQYNCLIGERGEVAEKIARLEKQISDIEGRIADIEAGETVKDRVYGGEGGIQGYNIEGVPTKEYASKKSELYNKRLALVHRKAMLSELEDQISDMTVQIERFIYGVNDSYIRRIINLRFIERLTWAQVAQRIGGGNTEGSVRMMFKRYMDEL